MSVSAYVGMLRVPRLNTDTLLSILTLSIEIKKKEAISPEMR